jgi:UDP-N-acetylmuramoyl-tripeptide--D-alanyl-D-alanine ligase
MNALAAVAVGLTFRVPAKRIRKALEEFRPTTKRMEALNHEGVIIYNDTYNANPDSMIAALRTLASAQVSGKKIAVLADMKELGDTSTDEHTRIGKEISALPIDYLLTFGEQAKHIHDTAKTAQKFHYEQKSMLAEYLWELVSAGDAVLVKGSRNMKMEDIVIFLQERLKASQDNNRQGAETPRS